MFTRIAVIGAKTVGKTQLIRKLTGSDYVETSTETSTLIPFPAMDNCNFWDFPGSMVDSQLTRTVCTHQASVVLLCFNLDNPDSFTTIKNFIEKLKLFSPKCKFVLVSTCSDKLEPELQAPKEVCEFIRENNNMPWVDTSAKENRGIDRLLKTIKSLCPSEHQSTTPSTLPSDPITKLSRATKKEEQLNVQDYSFLFKACVATAAVGGLALCIAALVVNSLPLAVAGAILLCAAAGTFFCRPQKSTLVDLDELVIESVLNLHQDTGL